MKTALISVSNKEGLLSFAKQLQQADYSIISTGGTAKYLRDNDIRNTLVEEITGFPEILDGRVKTLHPKILGAILADVNNPEHLNELNKLLINKIDLVVVNLYPFAEMAAKLSAKGEQSPLTHSDHQAMLENIDIGGVTLLRAAAKNYRSPAVVSSPQDYDEVIKYISKEEDLPENLRLKLAVKAFRETSEYDNLIYRYLSSIHEDVDSPDSNLAGLAGKAKKSPEGSGLPFLSWEKLSLRYGENPHQQGHFLYPDEEKIINVLHGKELSYNNYLDIDAALRLIVKFTENSAAIIKHTNPCGIASGSCLTEAYQKAFKTDTQSPFGGIVVTNKPLDLDTAKEINKIFTEIIIAPAFEEDVLEFLKKKKNRRLVIFDKDKLAGLKGSLRYISCLNGMLAQENDLGFDKESNWQTVTEKQPDETVYRDLRFAWNVVSSLKSNAICLAHNQASVGLGMGQTSRVDSLKLALNRAGYYNLTTGGSVCASDGFFPFRDSIDLLAENGIKAVIQPGGSKGDKDVIDACNEYGIAMIFTGMRHFNH